MEERGTEGEAEGAPSFGGEEHLYRAFFRATMGGILFADAEGGLLDANEEVCRLLGRTREELLAPGGGEIFDASDPRLAAAREEQWERGSFRGPLRVLCGAPGGGSAGSFEASVTVAGYRDGFGEDRLVIAIADWEGARPDPEEAKSAEETFASLSGYVGDAVVVFEVDGRLRYASPSIERLQGYRPEEIVGAVMLDVIHPDDLEYVVETCVGIYDSPGLAPPFTFRLRHKDGSWLYAEMAMNNLLDDPNVGAVVTIVRNVTERVRAEEEVRRLNAELERCVAERTAELEAAVAKLKENEEHRRATFEGSATGIAHVSPEGRYLRVNKEFCRITGYSREELLTKNFRDITHAGDVKKDEEQRERMLSGEILDYSVEKRYLRKDGSQTWVSLNVSFLRRATGKTDCFVLVAEDIDARKEAEMVLASLTTREKEVLVRLARGDTNARISNKLFIGESTVKSHVQRIIEKLRVENRMGAARRAAEIGLDLQQR